MEAAGEITLSMIKPLRLFDLFVQLIAQHMTQYGLFRKCRQHYVNTWLLGSCGVSAQSTQRHRQLRSLSGLFLDLR